MKKSILISLFIFFGISLQAQVVYSVATDISGLRSISKKQKFFAPGQTVQINFHLSKKETMYAWISYYLNGKFKNNLTATAKNVSVTPVIIDYTSNSIIRYRQLSLGWKHYFKGSFDNEQTWNLYGLGGFGLLLGKIDNTFSKEIDINNYNVPQQAIAGSALFKRLTFDLGLGVEAALGASIYLYSDPRTWLRSSDYPSPYLYDNNFPRVLILSGGIRLLID